MAERLLFNPDQSHEQLLPPPEHHEALPTHDQVESRIQHEKESVLDVHEAQERVQEVIQETKPESAREALEAADNVDNGQPVSTYIDTKLRELSYWREQNNIRRQLSAPQRALSRLIHQPVVRAVSEGTAKTAARPSGLLGGGMLAFLGTSGYLYLARHMGFPYNSGVFLAFFCGGFLLGVVIEFLVHQATRHTRHS